MTSSVRYLTVLFVSVDSLRYFVGSGVRVMAFASFLLFLISGALHLFEDDLTDAGVKWMISPSPNVRLLKSTAAFLLWGALILLLPVVANLLQFDHWDGRP